MMCKTEPTSGANHAKPILQSSRTKSINLFTLVETPNKNFKNENDLTSAFQLYLYIGRFIGVIPFDGVLKGSTENIRFRWKSFGCFFSCSSILVLGFYFVAGLVGFFNTFSGRSIYELARGLHWTIFFAYGILGYVFVLARQKKFIRFLNEWKSVKTHYALNDKNLKRDANFITSLVFLSAVLANCLLEMEIRKARLKYEEIQSKANNTMENANENLYRIFYPQLSTVVPYSAFTNTMVTISIKLSFFVGQANDVLLIILSRAVYYKFKLLNHQSESVLLRNESSNGVKGNIINWKHLCDDYIKLTRLLQYLDEFLSPLTFSSCAINIYYICQHITDGLRSTSDVPLVSKIINQWAFFHVTVRFFFMLLSGAKINEHALNTRLLLRECPREIYHLSEILRFENQYLGRENDIGLKGLGAFTLSKSFMLEILGVIFTVEIVLMQT